MFKNIRLKFLLFSLSSVFFVSNATAKYPDRPVTIVVPYSAGGTSDILARGLGKALSERWKVPVIVSNRSGAGGSIGTEVVVRSDPSGYTLLLHSGAIAMEIGAKKKTPYDAQKDLKPISMAVIGPFAVLASLKSGINSLEQLVSMAAENPGKLNFGTPGVGSSIHLSTELLMVRAGIQAVHVPFQGASPALAALAAGDIDFVLDPLATAKPLSENGRVKALAITTSDRSKFWPELPVVREAGVSNYDTGVWYGLFAPAKIPDEIATRIQADLAEVVRQPELAKWLGTIGLEPVASTPTQFAKQFDAEITQWGDLVSQAGLRLD
ncbi:tripartite tricarboxylate transporter substrate binding protein [Pollutimonas bauzanensis]|uniref:Bug family tripartite tricarboxylate transporter substrate binding protein n=1 Tax=Pollutimonas bauzanensis TaxID=658167 RepID=UPI003341E97A